MVIGCTALWCTIGVISYFFLNLISQTYRDYKHSHEKWLFTTYFTAMVHAAISFYLAVYSILYMCDGWEEGNNPLNSIDCVLYPKTNHYYILGNSTGYLIYDFLAYWFLCPSDSALAYQTYAHHILGASGFLCSFYAPRTSLVFGCTSMAMELSGIFLNFRWFTFSCNFKNDNVGLINTIFIFISYLLTRIIGQWYVALTICYPHFYTNWIAITNDEIVNGLQKDPILYNIAGWFMLVVNLLSQCINTYWFTLIYAQVKRNILKFMNKGKLPDDDKHQDP